MTFLLPEHMRPAPFVPGNIMINNIFTIIGTISIIIYLIVIIIYLLCIIMNLILIIIGIVLNIIFIITFGWVSSQRRQSFWPVLPLCVETLSCH